MENVVKRKEPPRLLVHILAWAVVFLLPFIFTSAYYDEADHERNGHTAFLYLDTVTKLFWVGLFYLNAEQIVPRVFYRKQYLLFIVVHLLLFTVIMLLHGSLFALMINHQPFNFFKSASHNMVSFLFTVVVSTAYKTITDKTKEDAVASQKQQEQLKTELSFLRSQISPHFLFNVLNNMVAFVRMKSDELEPTILKLSSLMQYMLYETDEDKVLLRSEVEYLQNYIDLQKQRCSPKLDLRVQFDVKENWHSIEPMLLIPFIENAFKHGNGLVAYPVIEVNLKADNNELSFTVKNNYTATDKAKDKTSGIGLANVKRRLALLYGDKQQLTIKDEDGWFFVSLQIRLT
ncbi:MAG: sensor histidine kinase [Flavisolibacter sp.]